MKRTIIAVVISVATVSTFAQGVPRTNVPPFDTLGPITLPTVFDSAGKIAGQLIATEDSDRAGVLLFQLGTIKDAAVTVRISRKANGDVSWRRGPMYYIGNNCTGEAFADIAPALSDYVARIDAKDRLLVGIVSDRRLPVTTNSVLEDTGCRVQTTIWGSSLMPIPLVETMDMTTQFKPPFSVGAFPKIHSASH